MAVRGYVASAGLLPIISIYETKLECCAYESSLLSGSTTKLDEKKLLSDKHEGYDKGTSEHFNNSAERLYTAVVQENRLCVLYP